MPSDQFIQSQFLGLWTIGSGVREAFLTPQIWNDNVTLLEACVEAEHNADGTHKSVTLFNENNVAAGIDADYAGRMYFFDAETNQITLAQLAERAGVAETDVMDIVYDHLIGDGIGISYDHLSHVITLSGSGSGDGGGEVPGGEPGEYKGYVAGGWTGTHNYNGYDLGSWSATSYLNTVDDIDFVSETSAQLSISLATSSGYSVGLSSPTTGYVYSGSKEGGYSAYVQKMYFNTIIDFVNTAISIPSGVSNAGGCTTSTIGYVMGGNSYVTNVDNLTYASEIAARLSNTLPTGRSGQAIVQSSIKSYVAAGASTNNLNIDMFTFETETATRCLTMDIATIGGVEAGRVSNFHNFSSSIKGIIGGGMQSGYYTTISGVNFHKITFSTEIYSSINISLSTTDQKLNSGACLDSRYKGYMVGGWHGEYTYPGGGQTVYRVWIKSLIHSVDMSSETLSVVSATIDVARVKGTGLTCK